MAVLVMRDQYIISHILGFKRKKKEKKKTANRRYIYFLSFF